MRKFNHIYDKIVTNEKDLVGIIAYSIYKNQKIEIIEQIKKDKSDQSVSENDLESFVSMSNTHTQIESYRNSAKEFLTEYSGLLLDEKLERIEDYYKQRAVGNFFRGVWQSVIGSILFTMLIGIVVFFLWSSKKGVQDVVQDIFEVEVVDEKSKLKDN